MAALFANVAAQPSSTDSSANELQQASPGQAQVVMKGIAFQPAQLTVRPGEVVEWKNQDIVAHTVTADDGSFDSGLIQPGETWKITAPQAASISYHCR
ncbi:MAG TPA: plastocyanin/azurin family copper-binding protein, partial [Candidatus Limnocylindrales bacterium]|nr:plastocyanin/azurin family copper-binding protein [Candidatus Limnocylindrales bacterium]